MAIVLNAPETSFSLALNLAVKNDPPSVQSPIDLFYLSRRESLDLAGRAPFNTDPRSLPLALVPVFAGAEMYFRRFIARVMDICPVAAETAATQQVAIGSFSKLDRSERAFAISEHQGFTSEGEIARRTLKVIGVDVNRSSSIKSAIADFESLCHVRHAIVHCGGELMFLNRRQLGLIDTGRLVLAMPIAEFQGVVLKVSNVVRSYNHNVGLELIRRWFKEGVMTGQWGKDRLKFAKLIEILWSAEDMKAAPDLKALYSAAKTGL